MITKLNESEEEILKHISKKVRYEIKRAEKENITHKIFTGLDINDQLLSDFNIMYNEMYKEKGMLNHWLPINEFKAYARNKACMISVSYLNNEPLVYHSYIFDSKNSRALHSCSSFRKLDVNDKKMIGFVNKNLLWEDMLFFKNKGVINFDWGGVSSFDNPNGIDEFKFKFGGTPKTYFNIIVAYSLRSRLWSKVRKVVKK